MFLWLLGFGFFLSAKPCASLLWNQKTDLSSHIPADFTSAPRSFIRRMQDLQFSRFGFLGELHDGPLDQEGKRTLVLERLEKDEHELSKIFVQRARDRGYHAKDLEFLLKSLRSRFKIFRHEVQEIPRKLKDQEYLADRFGKQESHLFDQPDYLTHRLLSSFYERYSSFSREVEVGLSFHHVHAVGIKLVQWLSHQTGRAEAEIYQKFRGGPHHSSDLLRLLLDQEIDLVVSDQKGRLRLIEVKANTHPLDSRKRSLDVAQMERLQLIQQILSKGFFIDQDRMRFDLLQLGYSVKGGVTEPTFHVISSYGFEIFGKVFSVYESLD
jgi:hypothetical protein